MYSNTDIEKLQNEIESISRKHNELILGYLNQKYESPNAKEHAEHGFLRRVSTIIFCMERIFELVPPNLEGIPEKQSLTETEVCLQAFLFNIYGCVDNLAWIWVFEKQVTNNDGRPLPNNFVGLRKSNKAVRNSLPQDLSDHLDSLESWFKFVENYRHALAHRIPPFIPPYQVPERHMKAYREYEELLPTAASPEEYDRLISEQLTFCVFEPFMIHSFTENEPPMAFHSQILADFNTVHDLGTRMLAELE